MDKIKELENELTQEKAKNATLLSEARMHIARLKKAELQIKITEQKKEEAEQKARDIEDYYNTEFKKCESCGHYYDEKSMEWIGNELICEMCRVNGYGR